MRGIWITFALNCTGFKRVQCSRGKGQVFHALHSKDLHFPAIHLWVWRGANGALPIAPRTQVASAASDCLKGALWSLSAWALGCQSPSSHTAAV